MANNQFSLSDFDYDLPSGLIAQQPLIKRDASNMLVLSRKTGNIQHDSIPHFLNYLNKNDVLVLNNTRVIPARIFGMKEDGGGRVETLFIEALEKNKWRVLLKSSRRPRSGATLILGKRRPENFVFLKDLDSGHCVLEGACDVQNFLQREGCTPLPPYIQRQAVKDDRERYQTVFAKVPGAVAAPTAGLHFTRNLLEAINEKGIKISTITLHVGPGTFQPVKVRKIEKHQMQKEFFEISNETAKVIRETRKSGGRVVCVGTTTVRALETAALQNGWVQPGKDRSDIFIYPPFNFQVTDALLTNFHLPRSTLIMLVSAFAGRELVLEAYREAVVKKLPVLQLWRLHVYFLGFNF